MNKVYTITVNSALEEVVFEGELRSGGPMKVEKKELYLTGKAVNTGLLLSNLGVHCDMSIVCGAKEEIGYMSFNSSSRRVNVYPVTGATRVNQTIVDGQGRERKIINNGYHLNPQQVEGLSRRIVSVVGEGDVVMIAGSLPDGMPAEWYQTLISRIRQKGALVFFDASGRALTEGVKGFPYYIKPNEQELENLRDAVSGKSVHQLLRALAAQNQIENVVVTLGERGALGYNAQEDIMVSVVSDELFPSKKMTTGCGDAFNAGFIYEHIHHQSFIKKMIAGVAFGGANLIAGFPEKITMQVIKERFSHISYSII